MKYAASLAPFPRPPQRAMKLPKEREMLYRMQAAICRVLAHPRRLQILDLLAGGEKSSQELQRELGISKMNLSQHLALMKHAGLVESRTEGRAALHRLAFREIKDACGMIRSVLAARLERGSELARSLR
ncbi:MAG: metalloregulator ArsR/SmtB family transcription factor [Acidobacteria bacterium]|nr:metalloregulator ArsR/SmtB family transcription factor [Acidobacteriota bacterium]